MRWFGFLSIIVFALMLFTYSTELLCQGYDLPDWCSSDTAFTLTIALGDFDANDTLDIVAGNYNYPYTRSALASANASNLDTTDLGGSLVIYWNMSETPTVIDNSKIGYGKIVVADIDKNDSLDIVAGCLNLRGNDGRNYIYYQKKSGVNRVFVRDTLPDDPGQDTYDIAVGDINNDGWMDIVETGVNGQIIYWLYDSETDNCQTPVETAIFSRQSRLELGVNVEGTAIELGDMNQDGKLDLFVSYGKIPIVFKNLSPAASIYDTRSKWMALTETDTFYDHMSCASFGWVDVDDSLYLGLAVGSKIHQLVSTGTHERRGSSIYILNDQNLEEVWRANSAFEGSYELTLDIEFCDLDNSGDFDIVEANYPTLAVVSGDTTWASGHQQYYLNPDADIPANTETPDWVCDSTDLSTSIAVGDLDMDDLHMTYIDISDSIWNNEERERLYYFDHSPIIWAGMFYYYDFGTSNWLEFPDSVEYCYHLQNGWVSIANTSEYDSVRLYYIYSSAPDLVVGNDGQNFVYYNNSSGGSGNFPEPWEVTTLPNYSNSTEFTHSTGSAFTTSQMDEEGAIGFSTQEGVDAVEQTILQYPDMNIMCSWFGWNNIEYIRGLYFWDWLDKVVDKAVDNDLRVVLLPDYSGAMEWTFPQTNSVGEVHPIDEKYSAYFARNLVNRYRPGGLLAEFSSVNDYSFTSTDGVEIYCFEGEPEAYGTPAYAEDYDALRYKLRLNYGMVKAIDTDFIVGSPNFHMDNGYLFERACYDSLYANYGDTPYALKYYTDIVNQQFWHVSGGDYSDPARVNWTEEMLDSLEDVFTDYGDTDKLLMCVESAVYDIMDDSESPTEQYADWTITQKVELFASKRFKWNLGGVMGGAITAATNEMAKKLKGHRFYYPSPYSPFVSYSLCDDRSVIDYIFEDRDEYNKYVHALRTDTLYLAEGGEVSIRLVTPIDSIDGDHVSIDYTYGFSEFERNINVPTGAAYASVDFFPYELDTATIYMNELIDGDYYDLNIPLKADETKLISLNLEPPYLLFDSIFTNVESDSLYISDYEENEAWRDSFGEWIYDPETFTSWQQEQGFRVWSIDNTELTVSNTDWWYTNLPINITPGDLEDTTNVFFITYTPSWDMPCSSAFKELLDWNSNDDTVLVWAANSDGIVYIPRVDSTDTYSMRQGEGYFLKLTNDSTLHGFQYTELEGILDYVPEDPMGDKREISSVTDQHFKFRKTTQNLYPIVLENISIDGVTPGVNDEIGVFMWDTVCVGGRTYCGESTMIIAAWEDEIMTPDSIDGFHSGEIISFKYWDASAEVELDIELNYSLESIPENESVHYSTSPIFGQKAYAVLSFGATLSGTNVPQTFRLHQNYPNPFNPATTIRFDLPEACDVKLEIFNIIGQQVAVLVDGHFNAGYKTIRWNATGLASGMYIYRIKADSIDGKDKFAKVRKMVLIK